MASKPSQYKGTPTTKYHKDNKPTRKKDLLHNIKTFLKCHFGSLDSPSWHFGLFFSKNSEFQISLIITTRFQNFNHNYKGNSCTPHYQQPFEIPDSWEWCTVGEISNYGSCSNSLVENIPDNAWVLELEDLEKDTGRILQRKLKSDREIKGVRHPFTKGVVLYSKLRTYLNKVLVAPENGFCTTEIVPITPEKGVFAPYLCLILRSSYFLSYTAMCGYGVKMPRLSTDDARKALIPLPPFREQERIVAIVSQCELLFHEIETEGNNIESLVEYAKNKILSLAISGKLVPQDPKDEPAIDLLHRINPKFTPDTSH